MHYLVKTNYFPETNDLIRDDSLIAAWKLGEYIDLLNDPGTRDFIEKLQQLAYAILSSIDEDENFAPNGTIR